MLSIFRLVSVRGVERLGEEFRSAGLTGFDV
jgi:hypothetical protein